MQLQRAVSPLLFYFLASVSSAHIDTLSMQGKTKQVRQLLGYLAADYGCSVKDGQVADADEYAKMQEFAYTAERQIAELPAGPGTQVLLKDTGVLRPQIADKVASAVVGEQAHKLVDSLLAAYPVPTAPNKAPDLKRGVTLYQNQYVSCHGSSGHADGILAAKLSPLPVTLADHQRAQERSVFVLQQIIMRDVEGTLMPSSAQFIGDDRWVLAYFALTLPHSDADQQADTELRASHPELHDTVPTPVKLSQTSGASLAKSTSLNTAWQLTTYLRSVPDVLSAPTANSLAITKDKLKENVAAFDQGDEAIASCLVFSAYPDDPKPVEPALAAENQVLFQDTEKTMGLYRNAITTGQAGQVQEIAQRLQITSTEAQGALGDTNDPSSTFLGALTILLCEGLEALFTAVAMMAFLKKAERAGVSPYVHADQIVALAAGGLTWAVATCLVDLSGASREMTGGFSAISAAMVPLGVGMQMHQKSLAGYRQAYVKQKLLSALNKCSAIILFVPSFVAVYREVFETVLSYVALWSEGNGIYLLAGLGSGAATLVAIAVALL